MPDILCFGDSNTYGTHPVARQGARSVRYARHTRWPCVMGTQLGDDWHLIEEGQPGRTTAFDDPIEGRRRNARRVLPALLESHAPLDVCVLMLGTNDQKHRFGLSGHDIALGAAKLVQMMQDHGGVEKILLVCPPLVTERGSLAQMFAGAEIRCADLPAELAAQAERLGVFYLDAGKHVRVDPPDGVHLSAESHITLGGVIAARVSDMTKE